MFPDYFVPASFPPSREFIANYAFKIYIYIFFKKKPHLFNLEVISKTQGSLQAIVCRFQYGPLLAQYLGLVVIPKTPAFFMPLA
jgi:hypothetical protein